MQETIQSEAFQNHTTQIYKRPLGVNDFLTAMLS